MAETNKAAQAVQLLASISRLGLKAFSTKSHKALIFLMLNDTLQVVRYDRAVLWEIDDKKRCSLLGISGEAHVDPKTALAQHLKEIVNKISPIEQAQILSQELLEPFIKNQGHENASVVWLPIKSNDKLKLGLWLERWDGPKWQYDEIEILTFLMQNYGAAWDKFENRTYFSFKPLKKPIYGFLLALFLLTFIIRIPLRIVAPCEVVPTDPILITAPLKGIIQNITVEPGQRVKTGDVLFEYDKKVPMDELQIMVKQVNIIQAEMQRALGLARKDPNSRAELGVLQEKLSKERKNLEAARNKANKLVVTSPIDGVTIIQDPDQWRGNPVEVGEKVMMVSDPDKNKVRIWIPEEDNVEINPDYDVRVILNVHPDVTYYAKIHYIASSITMSESNVPSFLAEANWIDGNPEGVKLGLKGTAILYGDKVSVIYWVLRKPWMFIRRSIGW
jgi:hypothetical protein